MASEVTAAVIREPGGAFSFETIKLDDLRSDEILVAIEACGVCRTDSHAKHLLPLPAILGHEGTGTVEAVGPAVSGVAVGDTVVISYGWCGHCVNCMSGSQYICDVSTPMNFAGRRLDGSPTIQLDGADVSGAFFQQSSFATHAITLARDVVVVEPDLPASMRAALPCGVQTGAGAILNTFNVKVGDSLLVAGSGAVGLSAIMAGKLAGAWPIVAVDIVDSRLQLALELGASHAVNARDGDVVEQISGIAPRGIKYALDTTNNDDAIKNAIACLGFGGTCGIVAPSQAETPNFNPLTDIFFKAARLEGVVQGSSNPATFIPKLIEYNRQGRFPYERLIREYDFKDIDSAFSDSESGAAIKPVLMMK